MLKLTIHNIYFFRGSGGRSGGRGGDGGRGGGDGGGSNGGGRSRGPPARRTNYRVIVTGELNIK